MQPIQWELLWSQQILPQPKGWETHPKRGEAVQGNTVTEPATKSIKLLLKNPTDSCSNWLQDTFSLKSFWVGFNFLVNINNLVFIKRKLDNRNLGREQRFSFIHTAATEAAVIGVFYVFSLISSSFCSESITCTWREIYSTYLCTPSPWHGHLSKLYIYSTLLSCYRQLYHQKLITYYHLTQITAIWLYPSKLF